MSEFNRRSFLTLAASGAITVLRGGGAHSLPNAGRSPASDPNAADGVTRQLAKYLVRVRPEEIPAAARKQATRTLHTFVAQVVGSLENPISDAALSEKATDLMEGLLAPGRIRALIEACWSVETLPRASTLARLGAGEA